MSSKYQKIDFTSMPRSAKYLNSSGSALNLSKSDNFKKDENSGSKSDVCRDGTRI